jgi:hypothetical protein
MNAPRGDHDDDHHADYESDESDESDELALVEHVTALDEGPVRSAVAVLARVRDAFLCDESDEPLACVAACVAAETSRMMDEEALKNMTEAEVMATAETSSRGMCGCATDACTLLELWSVKDVIGPLCCNPDFAPNSSLIVSDNCTGVPTVSFADFMNAPRGDHDDDHHADHESDESDDPDDSDDSDESETDERDDSDESDESDDSETDESEDPRYNRPTVVSGTLAFTMTPEAAATVAAAFADASQRAAVSAAFASAIADGIVGVVADDVRIDAITAARRLEGRGTTPRLEGRSLNTGVLNVDYTITATVADLDTAITAVDTGALSELVQTGLQAVPGLESVAVPGMAAPAAATMVDLGDYIRPTPAPTRHHEDYSVCEDLAVGHSCVDYGDGVLLGELVHPSDTAFCEVTVSGRRRLQPAQPPNSVLCAANTAWCANLCAARRATGCCRYNEGFRPQGSAPGGAGFEPARCTWYEGGYVREQLTPDRDAAELCSAWSGDPAASPTPRPTTTRPTPVPTFSLQYLEWKAAEESVSTVDIAGREGGERSRGEGGRPSTHHERMQCLYEIGLVGGLPPTCCDCPTVSPTSYPTPAPTVACAAGCAARGRANLTGLLLACIEAKFSK